MEHKERYKIILVLFSLGGLILAFNLLNHQVFNHEYRDRAENRTLAKKTITPPRGTIFDRNGKIIVFNQPSYELDIIYNEIPKDFDKNEFCALLDITPLEYDQSLQTVMRRHYFRKNLPINLISEINPAVYSRFQEHLYKFPGFYPNIKSRRAYPYPNAGHALGYVSEVNSEDIEGSDVYEIGDYKGASGIERIYDIELRGKKGLEYLLKDNIGREVDSYKNGALDSMATPGQDLVSSIDIELQALGEHLLQNKRGGIVAIEPSTGEILAMISSPSYDPNKLSFGKDRNETFLNLFTDTLNKPFMDRSLQAKYPPGSIFKPILALAALQEGITYPERGMTCIGKYSVSKGFTQGCRKHPRPTDIQTALQFSCNSYFFQLVREFLDQFGFNNPSAGLELLNKYLRAFGLGGRLGVDLLNENSGFLPSAEYYNNIYNTPEYTWRSTYVLSLGIGQGEIELTTIQMANLAAILANRGFYYVPHIINGPVTKGLLKKKSFEKRTVPVDAKHFPPVIEGMFRVVEAGTGRRAYVKGLDICGKTGTSQNPHGNDHSVFFGFAPKDNPKIAIAVFVENAGGGSALAAPVGSFMIEKYLRGSISDSRLPEEERILDINLLEIP